MIIGTAGHIDHGKTSLVKVLTGVDADRLPEEKKRGITIELGFAYAPLPNGDVVGFVDVPGHEKFVHTMAAGACGMDHGLIVIAADDGIMPQTLEHVRILDLLGVPNVTIAVTKADLVDSFRLQEVQSEIEHAFAQTRFASSPIFVVSTLTGAGVDALKTYLFTQLSSSSNQIAAYFRLAIDRVFVVKGLGVGVTGAINAGHIKVGDALVIARTGQEVKVRSIHAQNRPAEDAGPGSRCGIVLTGVEVDDIERGDWLLAPQVSRTTSRIDCQITMPADATRPLKDGELVLLHHGTMQVSARMILLDTTELQPGQICKAQCVMSRPLPFCWADRLVLRDGSARHTLAGARVLDTDPTVRGRKKPERLAELEALNAVDACSAITDLLRLSSRPLNLTHWASAMNQTLDSLQTLLGSKISQALFVDSHTFVCGNEYAEQLNQNIHDCLKRFHETDPDEPGLGIERLRRMCRPELSQKYFQVWMKRVIDQGLFTLTGSFVHLPDHKVVLSESERALWEQILPRMLNSGFDVPWVRDLAQEAGSTEDRVRLLLKKQARQSDLIQVVKDLFYPLATMRRIAESMQQLVVQHGFITVIDFRDQLGIGRKRAIQLLEALDRIGFSRRVVSLSRHGSANEKDQRMIRNADLFL